MLNNFFKSFLDVIYPETASCCFCNSSLKSWESTWCTRCGKEILADNFKLKRCTYCARFITSKDSCSFCKENKYPFSFARSAGVYTGKLKDALHDLKYRGKQSLIKPLGKLLGVTAVKYNMFSDIDFLVPVPIHSEKLKKRGFNQADLFTREVSSILNIPFKDNCLLKIKKTPDMVSLKKEERLKNLQGAFETNININLKGKRILLIDDVFTTGQTVSICSDTLLKSGAEDVKVLTVAANFDIEICGL